MVSIQLRSYLALLREGKALHIIAILCSVFIVLSIVIHAIGVLSIDRATTIWFRTFSSPTLDTIAENITHLGDTATLVTVAIVSALGFLLFKQTTPALYMALSLICLPINGILKFITARVRPAVSGVQVLVHTAGLSFPSGHTTGSTVIYGLLGFFLWTLFPQIPRIFFIFYPLLILLVGLTRIYLGAHWLSDVVGGWIVGLVCLLVLIEVHRIFTFNAI